MKAQYESLMAQAVAAQIQKATSLGIKASWSTAHHLSAVATVLASVEAKQEAFEDVLSECYNVSAFQQMLAKKFEKTGHFQRAGRVKTEDAVDSFLAMVEAAQKQG